MNKRWVAALVSTVGLVACGGGGGDSSSSPTAKAVTVQGTITGFGSVIIDGVHYETSRSEFEIDDVSGRSQDDLSVGQRVTVEGRIDDKGNRSASRVRYEAELNGPVTAVDAAASQFESLSQIVRVNESTVYLGLPNLGSLAVGEFVEVSGNRLADGSLLASFVKREDAESELQLRGMISDLDTAANQFRIGAQIIDYSAAAKRPADLVLADGIFVEVEGALQSSVLLAAELKKEDSFGESASGSEVGLEGLIRELSADRSSFFINGSLVRLTGATIFTGGGINDLAAGIKVEAEGVLLPDGSLQARKLDIRLGAASSDGRVEGSISAIDSVARRVTVSGLQLNVADGTVFRDSRDDNNRYGFSDLLVGDFVEVGFGSTGAGLVAAKIERDRASDRSLIKAVVDSFDAEARTLVVAGVAVTGSSAAYRANGATVSASQFFQQLTAGQVVSVKGRYAENRLSASEIELEGFED